MTPTQVLEKFRFELANRIDRIRRGTMATGVTITQSADCVTVKIEWGPASWEKSYTVPDILGGIFVLPQSTWEIHKPYCQTTREIILEALNSRGVLWPSN